MYQQLIGNITEDAIKEYIREQSEESGKNTEELFYRGPVTMLAIPAFQASM